MEPFYTQHKINIMLNKSLVNKAPPEWNGENWKQYYMAFQQTNLSPRQFAAQVFQGFSFSPCYKNGRRKKENFTEAWYIAFDFDDDGASLDYLMRRESFAWYFASFAYSTPSSTESMPKSRVIFIFDKPITDIDRYELIYAAMAQRFNDDNSVIDAQCKDGLRLYYGSENAEMIGNWSVITDDMCQLWIDEYLENLPPEPQKTETRVINPDDAQIVPIIEKLASNIAVAPVGEKHLTRRNNARAAGGYVSAGYLSQHEAEAMLIPSARGNSDTPDKAEREVIEGIEYGMNTPLYIEVRNVDSVEDLIL